MRTVPWDVSPDLPWKMLTGPFEQWAQQPTFLIGEYVAILGALIAFVHARRAGRANLLICVTALVAGTGNDLIFMALPRVDTFWQAQASIMLTPRLPLYIPCMYVLFMYWPTVAVRRVGLGRWSTAALTGLVACLLYAPYDIVGIKFLWWTWHDSDPAISARLLGVPVSSSLWVLTFAGSFALLLDAVLRDREVTRKRLLVGLALVACATTPLMMLQMTVLQAIDGGTPGYLAFGLGVAAYGVAASLRRRPLSPGKLPVDRLGLGVVSAFLLMLTVNMTFFAPETHVSAGLHQLPGPCDVEESDILGGTRKKFLCVDDYEEDFTFACTTPPADRTRWYTVCGKAHTNYPASAATVGGLSLAGIAVFSMLFGAIGRVASRGDERDLGEVDTAPQASSPPATRMPSGQRYQSVGHSGGYAGREIGMDSL